MENTLGRAGTQHNSRAHDTHIGSIDPHPRKGNRRSHSFSRRAALFARPYWTASAAPPHDSFSPAHLRASPPLIPRHERPMHTFSPRAHSLQRVVTHTAPTTPSIPRNCPAFRNRARRGAPRTSSSAAAPPRAAPSCASFCPFVPPLLSYSLSLSLLGSQHARAARPLTRGASLWCRRGK